MGQDGPGGRGRCEEESGEGRATKVWAKHGAGRSLGRGAASDSARMIEDPPLSL